MRVIANEQNAGFGAAVNQAFRESKGDFLAVLNDDTLAHPGWLAALIRAMETSPDVGMCASEVRLAGDGRLDSAGMLLCLDGSSKQRGHLESRDARHDIESAGRGSDRITSCVRMRELLK